MRRIKVSYFGLRSVGTGLLRALQEHPRVEIAGIHTRAESKPFSYFESEPLATVAEELAVPVTEVPEQGPWDCLPADLAIVCTFHRILKMRHLSKYQHVVNIHPSLLPGYRGATPTNWMIRNGETIVGLSAHLMNEELDAGPIIAQRPILNPYLNDNQLRKTLAFATTEVVKELVDRFPDYSPVETLPQDSSYHRPRQPEDAVVRIEELQSIEELIRHIKAFTNFPMPKVVVNGRQFTIDYDDPKETLELEVEEQRFAVMGYWTAEESAMS